MPQRAGGTTKDTKSTKGFANDLRVLSTSGACFVFFVVLRCTAGQGVACGQAKVLASEEAPKNLETQLQIIMNRMIAQLQAVKTAAEADESPATP